MAKGAKISATKAQKTKTVAKGLSKKTPLKTAVKGASSKAASKSSNKASKTKAASSKGAVSAKSTAPLKSIAKSASSAKVGAASPKASSGGPSLGKVSSKAPATKPSAGKDGARLQVVPRGIAVKPGKADIQGAAAAEATLEAETAPSLLVRAPEKSGKPEKKAKAAVDPKGERKARKAAKSLALALDKLADLGAQWNALYERSKELEAIPYKMSNSYEARTAIMHKVLGWGYVLSSQNDRLEVLFKDGIKMLISNYKG